MSYPNLGSLLENTGQSLIKSTFSRARLEALILVSASELWMFVSGGNFLTDLRKKWLTGCWMGANLARCFCFVHCMTIHWKLEVRRWIWWGNWRNFISLWNWTFQEKHRLVSVQENLLGPPRFFPQKYLRQWRRRHAYGRPWFQIEIVGMFNWKFWVLQVWIQRYAMLKLCMHTGVHLQSNAVVLHFYVAPCLSVRVGTVEGCRNWVWFLVVGSSRHGRGV